MLVEKYPTRLVITVERYIVNIGERTDKQWYKLLSRSDDIDQNHQNLVNRQWLYFQSWCKNIRTFFMTRPRRASMGKILKNVEQILETCSILASKQIGEDFQYERRKTRHSFDT